MRSLSCWAATPSAFSTTCLVLLAGRSISPAGVSGTLSEVRLPGFAQRDAAPTAVGRQMYCATTRRSLTVRPVSRLVLRITKPLVTAPVSAVTVPRLVAYCCWASWREDSEIANSRLVVLVEVHSCS